MLGTALITSRGLWSSITALGDSAVLLPCVALVVLWLAIPSTTRRLALYWFLCVLTVAAVVCASKLAFMGWMISLPGSDFTGLSGHTTLSMMLWPALGALVGRRHSVSGQGMGVLLGLLLGIAIGWSRWVLHAHSMIEIVLAWVFGGGVSVGFLWHQRARWCLPERSYVAILSLALVLPFVYGDRFPSQAILGDIAKHLSGHPPYTRVDLIRFRHAQAGTRNTDNAGERAVVVMSRGSYNGLAETYHLIRGKNRERLTRSISQLRAGQFQREA